MPNYTIFTYISLPASILRILIFICILTLVAGTWNATDFTSWYQSCIPYFSWALFSTLCWLTCVSCTNIFLRLSSRTVAWINASNARKTIIYYILPIIVGAICAGTFAEIIFVFTLPPNTPPPMTIRYWSWSAAVWGAFVAFCIIQWFHWYTQSQDPANNLAKLMELQARIRPHFLFNTINSAIALVRLDPDAAESVLQNLALLFRAALESGEGSTTTLEEEIKLSKGYLLIESLRLGDRLEVQWHIDDNFLDVSTPKLSLQPIIENAVRHGIEPTSQQGKIIIQASSHFGKIIITILNTIPTNEKNTKGHGIALENLRSRIALLYDFEGALKTEKKQDKNGQYWFKTILEIPSIREEKQKETHP